MEKAKSATEENLNSFCGLQITKWSCTGGFVLLSLSAFLPSFCDFFFFLYPK